MLHFDRAVNLEHPDRMALPVAAVVLASSSTREIILVMHIGFTIVHRRTPEIPRL